MSRTVNNIHKHELIGLDAHIIDCTDKGLIGAVGKIVDETKNTFRIDIGRSEKVIPKNGTILSVKIGREQTSIDTSGLRYRPEDRIKKTRQGRLVNG